MHIHTPEHYKIIKNKILISMSRYQKYLYYVKKQVAMHVDLLIYKSKLHACTGLQMHGERWSPWRGGFKVVARRGRVTFHPFLFTTGVHYLR